MRVSRPISLLLLVASSGCGFVRTTPVSRIPDDRALPTPLRRPAESSDDSGRENKKRVTAKQEPSTLIAADRSTCYVDIDSFHHINVGDMIACVWSAPSGRP